MAKDDEKEEGKAAKSKKGKGTLIPAVVVAVGLLGGAYVMKGGGGTKKAAAATTAIVVSYVGVRTLTSIVVGYAMSPRWARPERAKSRNDADLGA